MNLRIKLKELIKEKKYSISYVARAINVSTATLHLWLNDNYKGNVEKVTKAVKQFIELESLRNDNINIPFIATSVAQDVFQIAKTCHVESEIGVCCGDAGLGKTYAVKMYNLEHSDVILIEADLGYTPKVLFSEIHKILGFDGLGSIHSMLLDIIDKLKYSGRLIIVDEAEYLPYKALELLRRIYDKAKVGILLVGMPKLLRNLRGAKGQYTQLYSRIAILKELEPINSVDALAILNAVTPQADTIYPKISSYIGGNTRVLTKLLVRAIRIAKLNETEIDEDVVNLGLSQLIWSRQN